MAHYKTVCPADKKALENIKLMFHPDGRRWALLFRAAAAVPEISRASAKKSAGNFARFAPWPSVQRGEPPEGGATRTLFFGACVRLPGLHVQIILGLRFSLEWWKVFLWGCVFVGVCAVSTFHVEQSYFFCKQSCGNVYNLFPLYRDKKNSPRRG